MKRSRSALVMCALSLAGIRLSAQIQFQNLDFSAADPQLFQQVTFPTIGVPFSSAFPEWTGYIGTNQASVANVNARSTGAHNISINGSPYGGPRTAFLQSGLDPEPGLVPPQSVALAQTGFVPLDARSIQIDLNIISPSTAQGFTVSFGDENVPLFSLGSLSNYVVYVGDVSAFAGMTTELKLTVSPIPTYNNESIELYSIAFSPAAVPEPKGFEFWAEVLLLLSLYRVARPLKEAGGSCLGAS